jgi:predicted MFS family arabinose efflux permease
VLADRLPRGVILQGSSLAAALTQAVIAVAVLGGFATIPLLIVLSVANGAVAAIALPATLALTPQTVPAELLRPANAITRMGATTAISVGAPLGGLLAAVAGPGWAIAASAVVFVLAAGGYLPIRVPAGEHRGQVSRPLAELREGWAEFRSRTWVWVVVVQFMIVNAISVGGVQVLGPAIADETVGRPTWGLVLGIQAVGAFTGALIAARWHPRRALLVGIGVVLLYPLPLVVLGLAPRALLLMAAMFTAGVVAEIFTVAWDTSLQENIPADRLARVYSYDGIGSTVAIPLGEIAAGPVALHLGNQATLLAGAGLATLATLAALCSRDIRKLTSKPRSPVVRVT